MTVTSSIVCGRTHPYIMSPKTSPKPCWRRIAFPDSGEVVTGLGGCERIRASPRWPKKIRVRGRRNRNSHWRRHAELAELSTARSPREPDRRNCASPDGLSVPGRLPVRGPFASRCGGQRVRRGGNGGWTRCCVCRSEQPTRPRIAQCVGGHGGPGGQQHHEQRGPPATGC
jgi:hypothetical protein